MTRKKNNNRGGNDGGESIGNNVRVWKADSMVNCTKQIIQAFRTKPVAKQITPVEKTAALENLDKTGNDQQTITSIQNHSKKYIKPKITTSEQTMVVTQQQHLSKST